MKRGFTLIEMVLALALISLVTVLISAFSQSLYSAVGRIENTQALLDTVQLMRTTLAKSEQCRLNLKDLPLKYPQVGDTPVAGVFQYDLKTKTASSPLASPGQKMNGAIVNQISLRPLYRIESSLLMAELRVEFRPQGLNPTQVADGSLNVLRTLPMVVRIQSNSVADCWVRSEKASVDVDNICLQVSNGTYNKFDPATGTCSIANGKWFKGTLNSASCPKGSYIPQGADPGAHCRGDANFDDDHAKEDVQMQDGSTIRLARQPVIYNFSSANTCACDWAADLSVADLDGASCNVLCIVP